MKKADVNYNKYNFYYSMIPQKKRVRSTVSNSNSYYKDLSLDISLINKDKSKIIYNKNDANNERIKEDISKRIGSSDSYSSYYFYGSLPIKNKFIVDNLYNNKLISPIQSKNQSVTERYRKINKIAKKLNLFQNNYQISEEQPSSFKINSYFSEKTLKLDNNNYLSNNNNNNKYNNKTYLDQGTSTFTEIIKSKGKGKRTTNSINEKLSFRSNCSFWENKANQKNVKESDLLYQKIFHNSEKKRKSLHFDNKLNLFYSENEAQYKKLINKINNKLYKKGKRTKHTIFDDKSKIMKSELNEKVIFMKRIVDYLYPNMIFAKLKEDSKRRYKNQRMAFKLPPSKVLLLEKKDKQKALELYLGNAFSLIK
jgi:hypothetical protein